MAQKIVNVSEIEALLAEMEEKYHNQWRDDLSSHSEGMADAVAHIGALLAPLLNKAPSAGNWTDFSIDTTKADYIQIGNIVYFGLKNQGEQHALQEAIRAVASKAFERGRDSVVTAPSVSGEATEHLSEFAKQPIGKIQKNGEIDLYDTLDIINEMEGFEIFIHPQHAVYSATPQPDRVAELEDKLKVAVEALHDVLNYGSDAYAGIKAGEALGKLEE